MSGGGSTERPTDDVDLAARGDPADDARRPASPFVGLVPFDEADAPFFFGRAQETAIVAANLRSTRLTILYGPSGVGKSSLLMAGAVHELREEARAVAGESPFAVCVCRSWRGDPVPGLQEAARLALTELGARGPAGATLVDTLRDWTAGTGTLLVVLDQFEEYFQYHPDEDDGERLSGFAAELARLVNDQSLPVHLLLSIREDALARLDRFEGHIPSLFSNYLRVEHLDTRAARRAIEGPIAAWNGLLAEGEPPYRIEPELVDEVIAAAAGGRLVFAADGDAAADPARDHVEAPFLQLVLERLWRDAVDRGDRSLTVARLDALGGARRIVQNHLLDALGTLTPVEQGVAADAFRFLVTRSQTKIAHPALDLAEWTNHPMTEVAAVLDKLAGSGRILRRVAPSGDDDDSGASYELFHDVLAEPIVAWRRAYEQDRERRRVRRRFLRIGGTLLGLVAVFAALGIWALVQRHDAQRSAEATKWLSVAVTARESVDDRLPEALLLGLAANEHSDSREARDAMILALQRARAFGVSTELVGPVGPVGTVAFSPNGRVLASGGEDEMLRLWNARTREQVNGAAVGHVRSMAFSTDGRLLATGLGDGITLWDVRTLRRVGAPLARSEDDIIGLAFGPGDETLASLDADGALRLWTVATRALIREFKTRSLPTSFALSPDGRSIATGDVDGSVEVLDTMTGALRRRFVGPGAAIDALAFTPNGRTLAVAGPDGTVSIRDVARGVQVGRLQAGPDVRLVSLALSRAGTIAAGSSDGKIWVWDLDTRRQLRGPLQADSTAVQGVSFSGDGSTLASAGGALRLWDIAGNAGFGASLTTPGRGAAYRVAFGRGRLLAASLEDGSVRLWTADGAGASHVMPSAGTDAAYAVAFSPDGSLVASGAADGRVRLWNVARREQIGEMTAAPPVYSVAFAPDGRSVAAASTGAVRRWSTDGSEPLQTLHVEKRSLGLSLVYIAISPDGAMVAATDGEDLIFRWDVGSSRPLAPFSAGRDVAFDTVAFAPQAHLLAAADSAGVIRLWDSRSGARRSVIDTGQRARVVLAFSPDGGTLATAGQEGSIRLWDMGSRKALGGPMVPPEPSRRGIFDIAFSRDGRTIATAGADGSVRVWSGVLWAGDANLAAQVCDLVAGNLSAEAWQAEWAELAPGLAYEQLCPQMRRGA